MATKKKKKNDRRGNLQNLVQFKNYSPEQLREWRSKGGKAAAAKKRERKTLKDELLAILSSKNYNKRISTALVKKATKGDTYAFITIRDTIGEKPIDKVMNADVKLEDLLNDDENLIDE